MKFPIFDSINNSPPTKIVGGLSSSSTIIEVEDTSVFPPPPNVATISFDDNAELVYYTAIEENTLANCVRGYGDTAAQQWTENTPIYVAYTTVNHQAIKGNIDDLYTVKLDSAGGDIKDTVGTFTEASARANIASGATMAETLGKISKFFTDLKPPAFAAFGTTDTTVAKGKHASQHGENGADPVSPSSIGALETDGDGSAVRVGPEADAKTLADLKSAAFAEIGTGAADVAGGIHATQHGKNGSDPVSPASIGAIPVVVTPTNNNILVADANGNAKDSKTPVIYVPNPAFAYSGRNLDEYTPADIKAMCTQNDFSEIRVGDYYPMTLTTGEVVLPEVAGIDPYLNYGDTALTAHHIDMISRDCLATTRTYNATATNSGGYVGSALKTTLNSTIWNTVPAAWRAVISNKRGLVETKTAASATSWSWQDLGNLWLPSEIEVWGTVVWGEVGWSAGLAIHYDIFKGSLRHIVKGLGNGGSRASWWLLPSRFADATSFCRVGNGGNPLYTSAATASGVPLCFRISG